MQLDINFCQSFKPTEAYKVNIMHKKFIFTTTVCHTWQVETHSEGRDKCDYGKDGCSYKRSVL